MSAELLRAGVEDRSSHCGEALAPLQRAGVHHMSAQSVVVWLALWAAITDAKAVFLHVMAHMNGDVCMDEASAFVYCTEVLEF